MFKKKTSVAFCDGNNWHIVEKTGVALAFLIFFSADLIIFMTLLWIWDGESLMMTSS